MSKALISLVVIMAKTIIGINLKAYAEALGKRALEIAEVCEKVKEERQDVEFFLCVQAVDIRDVAKRGVDVFAEHVDAVEPGAKTGHITVEAVKDAGAKGVMLNHSEKRIRIDEIEYVLNRAKEKGLKTLVCAATPLQAKALACLNPDYVAVEPPELIGGNVSVSKAKPEVVKDTVSLVREVNKNCLILVGAGIKNSEDVKRSVELGANGVLLASAVAKAKDVEKAIKNLLP